MDLPAKVAGLHLKRRFRRHLDGDLHVAPDVPGTTPRRRIDKANTYRLLPEVTHLVICPALARPFTAPRQHARSKGLRAVPRLSD